MTIRFHCATCGEEHEGIPSLIAPVPFSYSALSPEERETRGDLGSDECVIDETQFFVRGCLDIPVHGSPESFTWGVWVSLSEASFLQWIEYFDQARRAHIGPFFGWLNTRLTPYPDTLNLKTMVHLRDDGIRPRIELEPTDHPLAIEQRQGITLERLAEIHAMVVHGTEAMDTQKPDHDG